MRNWLITLLAMLLAFTACQPEPIVPDIEDSFDPAKLHFNLAIQHPEGTTKGVKSNWENGDKVFIFIPSITTGYLTATFNGTIWTAAYEGTGTSLSALGDSGLLHAVYLPYVNDATPVYSNSNNTWTFNTGTDTYFFYASKQNYTVETVGEDRILLASIQMRYPGDYVQFYIPYDNPTGTIQFACNALRPAGFAGITADNGEVTEITGGSAGAPIYGYADTLANEAGYYVSGKPVATSASTADYYFAVKKDDIYSHYYKNRNVIAANKAYQLPAYSSWPVVGSSRYVQIANSRWKTVNEEASDPWAMGTLKAMGTSLEGLPTNADWSNLKDSQITTWIPMSIWGSQGYLVASKSTPQKYIFIPWSGDASYYWMAGFANTFKIAESEYTIPEPANVPETAYVRTLNNLKCFRIKAKEDGTKVYFYYTDGSVKYSKDGETWETPPTQASGGIALNANEEVYFKGTRTDCNLQGSNQLFTTNGKVCYIAGDITSLLKLNDPATLPANAFRSAFSYGNTVDGNNGLDKEKNLPVASGSVDWVDIDQSDPLILPASTSTNCYVEMFMNCTSLTWAPDLPATDLADKCYFRMFYGCSKLTSIPTLPSVVNWKGTSGRQRYCFQMFQYCTGIESLTEPLFGGTTTLARGCFEDMFAHCTGLTSVIQGLLPATTLAEDCYRGMFQDTRFERAPDLLVGTLSWDNCYRWMFNGCTKLKYVKCLATNNSNGKYTNSWMGGGVPNNSSCIFVMASNASWPSGESGILSNWTVQ